MKKSLGARTLIIPTPTWIICTFDADGKANAMTAAWAGVCCSDPPSIAVSIRKPRHTYQAITTQKAFTVNVPSEQYLKEADYFGVTSGSKEDKFAASGLTPVRSQLVNAPFIGEFPLILECKLVHSFELGIHTQFVGEILDVKADQDVLSESGYPDICKVKPIVYSPGSGTYHGIGKKLGKGFSVGKK